MPGKRDIAKVVQLHDATVDLQIGLDDKRALADTPIMHHDVDVAKEGNSLSRFGPEGAHVHEVQGQDTDLAGVGATLLYPFQFFRAAAGEDKLRAFGAKGIGQGFPDAGGGPGDPDDF